MFVKDVMTRDVITITQERSFMELIKKIYASKIHTLPVLDDEDSLVGIVDVKDIMKIFLPHNPSLERLLRRTHSYNGQEENILEADISPHFLSTVKVRDIMDTNIVTVDSEETIAEARSSMALHDIIHVPVIHGNRLVGIISLTDIIAGIFRERGITV